MKRSEHLDQLFADLAKAKLEYKPLVKDMYNPFFKSYYPSKAACIDATREALSKYGITVTELQEEISGRNYLETLMAHKSGQWFSSSYPIMPSKEDSQGYGAAVTYAGRYAYIGITGLAPEDDDGELASGRVTEVKQKPMASVQKTDSKNHKITTENKPSVVPNEAKGMLKLDANACVRLKALADSSGWSDDQLNDYMDRFMKVSMLRDLTVNKATELANVIKNNSYEEAVKNESPITGN